MERYPEEYELETIRQWEVTSAGECILLLEYIESLWWEAGAGFKKVSENEYELHTCGWSGNEEIIGAMSENTMFWGMCWLESKRGGHFKFEIPEVGK